MKFRNCDSNAGKVKLYENTKQKYMKISKTRYKDLDHVIEIDLREYQGRSIRRSNNKADSIETGRLVIAHLLPKTDLEKCMYTTLF